MTFTEFWYRYAKQEKLANALGQRNPPGVVKCSHRGTLIFKQDFCDWSQPCGLTGDLYPMEILLRTPEAHWSVTAEVVCDLRWYFKLLCICTTQHISMCFNLSRCAWSKTSLKQQSILHFANWEMWKFACRIDMQLPAHSGLCNPKLILAKQCCPRGARWPWPSGIVFDLIFGGIDGQASISHPCGCAWPFPGS